jgi:hypothetical protein
MHKEQIFIQGSDEWYLYIRDLWKQTVLAALQGGQEVNDALRSADRVLDAFNMEWTTEE